MIINFSVENFSSIKEKQVLSFEADKSQHLEDHYVIKTESGHRLLKLGLIYGANASGKTNILKALDYLRELVLEPVNNKTTELNFEPFLMDEATPNLSTILSIEFLQNNIKYFYEIEFIKKAILKEELYSFNPSKSSVFKRTTDLENQFTNIKFGKKISIDSTFKKALESNTLWNNTVLAGFLKTNIEIKELQEVSSWFFKYLQPIILPSIELDYFITSEIKASNINKKEVITILRNADFNISDIVINEKKMPSTERVIEIQGKKIPLRVEVANEVGGNSYLNIEFEHSVQGNKYRLPFELESLGTQRFYGFAGLISVLINNSSFVFIDELESSLHPDLFTHFILSFLVNSKNSQLLATTHNREILNNKDIFRNDAIWFTEKNENSATELYSLAEFDTSVIRDTSNVYNAYKIGKLGAVPKLGDYYIDLNYEK